MITKYFTKVVVRFNPMGKEGACYCLILKFPPKLTTSGKAARLFLSSIPPSMKGSCIIDHKVITDGKTLPSLAVTFKDKKTLELDPSSISFSELTAVLDRHSRALQIKESIEA